jgi:hypothetical protein
LAASLATTPETGPATLLGLGRAGELVGGDATVVVAIESLQHGGDVVDLFGRQGAIAVSIKNRNQRMATTSVGSLGTPVTARPLAVAGIQAIKTTGSTGVSVSISTASHVGSVTLGPFAVVAITTRVGSFALIAPATSLGSLAWLVFLGGRFVLLGDRFVLVGTLVGCCRKAEQDAQPQHGHGRDQRVFH